MSEPDIVHISSLVVHFKPEFLTPISAALTNIHGLEIQGHNDTGKMVVTLETATEHPVLDAIRDINELPGVLNTSLVFHQIDDASAQEESLPVTVNVGEEAL
ncbi:MULTISPECIES: chaperone NapD [Corallincola]|uniref:Chaperone NapD n=3 Tax=Corallincola TaxID=1775176 RepID=A0A368NNF2_9GAMM|nr:MULTISPECIES: chaperone NapD [Corallincola]RCU51686.1 hypothetical protein DU002_04230 [Corallincola holothuriorum]TAA47185.1 hypothetical protein EXY25_08055 [Corallincola spongiicola]TCI04845.1 hypothetical protein EZV61_02415 [Corallincola luteus]